MTDYSFNTIIDTSTLQIGQVVRINFTDDGIFRVFYNDSNGNMYCGLSRQSNYRQVIADSAHKRTQIDISSSATDIIALNNFNPPMYGGTYHEEQLRIPIDRNDKNFYVFKYDINDNIIQNSPRGFFGEIQTQSYIKQGSTSGSIYQSNGYSSILASGKSPLWQGPNTAPFPDYYYNNSAGFIVSGKETSTAGRQTYTDNAFIPFPDYMDLYGQTINNITNKPLNTNYSWLSNLTTLPTENNRYGILPDPYGEYGSKPNGNGSSINCLYTIKSRRPKYVWLDTNNYATDNTFNPGDPGLNNIDQYYKGIFNILAYTNNDRDLSGNVYL